MADFKIGSANILSVDSSANKVDQDPSSPSLKRRRFVQSLPCRTDSTVSASCTQLSEATKHNNLVIPRKKKRGCRRIKSPQASAGQSQDMEDMEVEYSEVVNKIHEVREQLQAMGHQPMTQELKVLSENVQQSRSQHNLQLLKLFIVVDTNVLIDDIKYVDTLKDRHVANFNQPLIVIPWVVVQELDCIKDGKQRSSTNALKTKARRAVSYLNEWLERSHPRVLGQTPSESLVKRGDFTVETNDDRILQCCLQFSEKYAESRVVLLTMDRNLRNKAMIMHIPSYTILSLQDWLNTQGCECSSDAALPPDLHESDEPITKRQFAFNANTSLKACNGVISERVDKSTSKTPVFASRLSNISVDCSNQLSGTSPKCNTPRKNIKNCPPLLPAPVNNQQPFTTPKCDSLREDQPKKCRPLLSIPVSHQLSNTSARCDSLGEDRPKKCQPLLSIPVSHQLSNTSARCDSLGEDRPKKCQPLLSIPVSHQLSNTSARCDSLGEDQPKKCRPLLSIPVSHQLSNTSARCDSLGEDRPKKCQPLLSIPVSHRLSDTSARCDSLREDRPKKCQPLLSIPVSHQLSDTSARCDRPGLDQNKTCSTLSSLPVYYKQSQVNTVDLQKVPNVKQGQAAGSPVSSTTSCAVKQYSIPRCGLLTLSGKTSSASSSHLSSINKISNSARKLATSLKHSQMTQQARNTGSQTNVLPGNGTQFSTAQVTHSKLTLSGQQQIHTVQKLLDSPSIDKTVSEPLYEGLKLTSRTKSIGFTSRTCTTTTSRACSSSILTSNQARLYAQSAESVSDKSGHTSCSADRQSKTLTVLKEIEACLQKGLSEIIEREMKAIYGDIWLQVVIRRPPWSFADTVECLNKSGSEMRNYSLVRSKLLSRIEQIEQEYNKPERVKAVLSSARVEYTPSTSLSTPQIAGTEDTTDSCNASSDKLQSSQSSQMEFQQDVSSQLVLAPDRQDCIQQLFQTTWEGIYSLQMKFCDALASPGDTSMRTAVLDAFVKFCQSVACISTTYSSALEPSSDAQVYHKLSLALDQSAQLNKFQIEPFTSPELQNFFVDDRNREKLVIGQQQLQSMMTSLSEACAQRLTPLELQFVRSSL